MVPWDGLQGVIVLLPDHIYVFFWFISIHFTLMNDLGIRDVKYLIYFVATHNTINLDKHIYM